MDIDITINLLVALAVGAILGLEREWKAQTSADPKLDAGLRTFAVVGLLGGVSVIISRNISPLFSPALLLGLAGVVYVSYKLNATKSGDYGTTSEVSLLLVFALGALAGIGYKIESLAFAAITAAILRFKTELHGYVRGLEKTELDATIQLLLIAIVAIPLLPNTQLGPGGAINPRTIGLLVLLIAGVSYLGYFATRIFGSRIGLLLTAALGGLTSSTAVTVAFSRLKSHNKEISTPLIGAGISLSAAMMGPRLIAEVAVVNADIARQILAPMAALSSVPLLAAVLIARNLARQPSLSSEIKLKNPLQLETAFIYGIVLSLLFVFVYFAQLEFGDRGVYFLAAISGIADVDAVSVSLAKLANGMSSGVPSNTAVNGILIAVFVNTITKSLLALFLGGWALAKWCSGILMLALLAGLATSVVTLN